MTPEPPAPTPRRKRRYLRWLGVLLLAYFAYAGWKAYDYRAAVEEAKALGWTVEFGTAFDHIKRDWRAALRMETWTQIRRVLEIDGEKGFTGHESLVLRLNPQSISIYNSPLPLNLSFLKHLADLRILEIQSFPEITDANMDQIQELTLLRGLFISDCPRLTHLNPLIGLKKLEWLELWYLPLIPKSDIQAFHATHPNTIIRVNHEPVSFP